MKILNRGRSVMLGLTLVAACLAAPSGLGPSASAAPEPDPDLVREMRETANGRVGVRADAATGKVGFVTARGRGADLLPGVGADQRSAAVDKAAAYLERFAPAFGADAGDLERADVVSDRAGTSVSYTQTHDGLPVFGSMVRLHLDRNGDLTAVNGELVPVGDVDTDPRLSATDAAERAVAAVRADPPQSGDGDADTTGVEASAVDLVVYRTGLVRGSADGEDLLVYAVEVGNGANVRDMVFLDAHTGKAVNRYSMVHDALERHVYEQTYSPEAEVWAEGDAYPGNLNQDQRNIVDASGESYWFFHNAFGRDSYDDDGHKMEIVNNDPRISCPNANWNGTTTNYCNGVTSDDVVAHEWGHAYTEHTHGLIYQWQPGALNESYSDIWGETVDLINGRADDEEGDITTPRPAGQCTTHTRSPITATIDAPAEIAGPCAGAAPASFGPVFPQQGVTADVVVAQDAANTEGPSATDGCTAFSNASAVAGGWAYVDRGTCTFAVKAQNAKAAGATGLVVGDNVSGRAPISMSGTADIYGLMVTLEDGARIKSVAGPVTMTVRDASTDPKTESYRWLMGEDSPAFGGAIRDMWNPNCYGDPGKVSDAQYHCSTDDAGGVHSNSGVPNHAYALTVDGGTFNGTTVTGIGLTKAAAVYYRAMTHYQTPVSDFTDHADALAQSCSDLVGQPLRALSTAANDSSVSDQVIAEADCATFDQAAAAVELRRAPTQCAFGPLLDPDTPASCGDGFTTETVWTEDFEDGLAGWGTDQEVVYAGASGMPWEATTSAPGGHSGGVAYGPAPDRGECDGTAADFSSRDSITSPVITLPKGKLTGQKLSFEHYVATETGYDGGNVKYKAGRRWVVIPASAYVFNPPTVLESDATNTNPMAGEEGFTGTDGGLVTGSWGTSIVDLAALRVKGGSSLQLRFDVGRDGCGGIDGWYVDNVTVSYCKPAAGAREDEAREG